MPNDVARDHFEPFLEILKERAEVVRTLEDHPEASLIVSEFRQSIRALTELIYIFGTNEDWNSMLDKVDEIEIRAASHV